MSRNPAEPGVLGARLRELRKARGWTASRLAEETGGAVSPNAIAKLETNVQDNVTLAQGLALAHALGVSVEQLMDVEVPTVALVVAVEIAYAKARLADALTHIEEAV